MSDFDYLAGVLDSNGRIYTDRIRVGGDPYILGRLSRHLGGGYFETPTRLAFAARDHRYKLLRLWLPHSRCRKKEIQAALDRLAAAR